MKIVINRCYGGFSLSPKATKRLAELRGRKCFMFKTTFASLKPNYILLSEEEIAQGSKRSWMFFQAFDVEDVSRIDEKDFYSQHSIDARPDDRTDPLLIQVVEELGEEADGACASLRIIEIPDGIDYEIDDYDGMESVEEKHRRWT